jgi:hypothetical protein
MKYASQQIFHYSDQKNQDYYYGRAAFYSKILVATIAAIFGCYCSQRICTSMIDKGVRLLNYPLNLNVQTTAGTGAQVAVSSTTPQISNTM